uniref:Encapsidation protein 22K n=1 Tax=Pacific black duck aviadenovirus TaxID=2798287 RepID=A0A7T4S041_9ADEN|nr:encapsidation protein 22K [Pacific black duck aviadenovirus]
MTQKHIDMTKEMTAQREEEEWESIGSTDTYSEIEDTVEDEDRFIECSEDPIESQHQAPPIPQKSKSKRRIVPPTPQNSPKKSKKMNVEPNAKHRGKYNSWYMYRVDIYDALMNSVFNRELACKFLKAKGIYVPPSILAYYARHLCASPLLCSTEESEKNHPTGSSTHC